MCRKSLHPLLDTTDHDRCVPADGIMSSIALSASMRPLLSRTLSVPQPILSTKFSLRHRTAPLWIPRSRSDAPRSSWTTPIPYPVAGVSPILCVRCGGLCLRLAKPRFMNPTVRRSTTAQPQNAIAVATSCRPVLSGIVNLSPPRSPSTSSGSALPTGVGSMFVP